MSSQDVRRLVEWQPERVAEESAAPPPDRCLAGNPQQRIRNLYADASGQFFAGVWHSTPGRWRVAYTEHEFCRLTRGRIRIESDDGIAWTYAAGDSFVVPAGFTGIWEVIEEAEKQYVIFEPRAT